MCSKRARRLQPTLSGRLARRFDLAIVAQAEPDGSPSRELIIEAVLFESGARC